MVRVAMLSYWHVHAADYTRQAQAHPDTEIVAVWDENEQRGRAKAADLEVPFYASLDDLLAIPEIDGVIVDAPTSLHRDVMVKAANAGKHIFTEKVVAATLHEANEIEAAVREAGVKWTISLRRMNEQYSPPIRQVLTDGLLGELTLVRIRDAHDGATSGWLVDHFFNKEETCGGALIDLGCHPMYLTRLFLGRPDSVSASFGYVTGKSVEDNAVSVLRYATGAIGIVETGFVTKNSPFSVEIYGTEGSLLYGTPEDKILLRTSKAGHSTGSEWAQLPVNGNRASAFEQWVDHIVKGTPNDDENIEIAMDLTRLMEASNLSAAQNRAVSLSELQA